MVFSLPAAPVELPLELPEPMLPLLEPEPLVLGEAGEAGDVVELELPLPALEPDDLLKCASHSEREICPSLLVSTDEKLGLDELLLEPDMPLDEPVVLEPPEAALPDEDLSDEPDVLLPDAEGVDEEVLCATATLDSANSAAAVAALRTLSFNIVCLLKRGRGVAALRDASRVPLACRLVTLIFTDPAERFAGPWWTATMLLPSGSSTKTA